jgi:hypothetical protein
MNFNAQSPTQQSDRVRRGKHSKESAMHRANRLLAGIISLVGAASAGAVQGDGLTADPEQLSWGRWQGRVSLGSLVPWQTSLGRGESTGLKVDSVSLVGDYYFSRSLVGHRSSGGFRTTGGVVHGPRAQLANGRLLIGSPGSVRGVDRQVLGAADGYGGDVAPDVATLPYLGVGYSGLSLKGGWRFNADLGMMALSPGNSVKLGRVVGGTQSLDELLREMRLAPMLQVGVSYSF